MRRAFIVVASLLALSGCSSDPQAEQAIKQETEPTIPPEIARQYAGAWALYAEPIDRSKNAKFEWAELIFLKEDGTYEHKKWNTAKFAEAPKEATTGTWSVAENLLILHPERIGGKSRNVMQADFDKRMGEEGSLLLDLMFQNEPYSIIEDGNAFRRDVSTVDEQFRPLSADWIFRFQRAMQ
jgi:hypothetical protein